MAQVKFHKFVAALPAELDADAIYYVRAGAGFDIYVTNSSGTVVAYPLNVGGAGQGFFRTEPITATATGQTVFTVPGGYTPGAIIVSLNGASLPPADYTAMDGTTVVLASGAGIVAGSVLLVYALSAFEVADALPIGGTAADSSKLGGTPEAEFYKRANILGTVSQSGGVPTGAIIERGSNASGEYVRFADGTQVCWKYAAQSVTAISIAYFGGYRSADVQFSFPAVFAVAPVVYGTVSSCFGALPYASTEAGFSCNFLSISSAASTTHTLRWCAIGRWY